MMAFFNFMALGSGQVERMVSSATLLSGRHFAFVHYLLARSPSTDEM